jgi:hypothetical protein
MIQFAISFSVLCLIFFIFTGVNEIILEHNSNLDCERSKYPNHYPEFRETFENQQKKLFSPEANDT